VDGNERNRAARTGDYIVPPGTLACVTNVQRIQLGYNNVYVVDASAGRVMVDAGPDYKGAREAIHGALGQLPGVVVATHGHLDHAGLGKHWIAAGVPVAIGSRDVHLTRTPQLADRAEFERLATYVRSCGAPVDVRVEVMAGLEQRREWARAAAQPGSYQPIGRNGRWPTSLHYEHFVPSAEVGDGDGIEGTSLEVLECPGHTPGNLVLIDTAEGWLFSGDQLLPEMTPTPAVQAKPPGELTEADWRFRSLPAFVSALRRLRTMEFSRCFPGHGEPFDDVRETIEANIAQVEQRGERVAEAIAKTGRCSLYSLCEAMYPRAFRRRFWQIASTVQGHLDLLEDEGRVRVVNGLYEV
jgi:glyoxylase-like metal-dependent hydrolase (beta-lactamase superfamily II)